MCSRLTDILHTMLQGGGCDSRHLHGLLFIGKEGV